MDDTQLQGLLNSVNGLSERLATEGRYVDAAVAAGAVQALRALRTRLEPPEQRPALAVVTEG